MIHELQNEKALIKQCQNGDIKAFEDIYHHFKRPLFSYALRILGNTENARDAVQITFVKLYQKPGYFAFKSKFSSYLFRILINTCYDLTKTRKMEAWDTLEPLSSAQNSNQDLKMQLEEAIQFLPLRMRECFVLFAVEGFKQDEIAEMLSISIGAVKAHIFKAKQKLKILLADVIQETVV